MSTVEEEIGSQPGVWRASAGFARAHEGLLPANGERVAFIGCGTSYYVSQALAALRESRGQGESDAFFASELPTERRYDVVVAISRSGTTTEVVRALEALPERRSLAISAVPGSPVLDAAGAGIVLDFADEQAVVQTRFATAVVALGRAWLGESLEAATTELEAALAAPAALNPSPFEQFVFLGRGWTIGLASEAALKLRECAGAWAESYPAMEYRHGPISASGETSLVCGLGPIDPGVLRDAEATGATVRQTPGDPLVELVQAQRLAVALAKARRRDPNFPAHLTRSVVLG